MVMREPLHEDDPARIGAYRLLGRLGEGGMGVVYLAKDPGGELVALKAIRAPLANRKDFRARFRAELETAAKVAPFCTAPILDADTTANPPYVVTEYIDGPTLGAVVNERGPLSGSQLHALGVGVASALTAIHHAEVIHRDLKPGNVLLSRFGPRVIDFGIARSIGSPGSITQSNIVMGSPSFMAPEQWQGEKITPKVDVFAWGALMAFAGTSREPFSGPSDTIPYQILHGEPDLDGLDPELKDLVTWTMHKNPDRRPSAPQLLEALVGGDMPAPPRAMHDAPTSAPPAHTMFAEGPTGPMAVGTMRRHGPSRGTVLSVWVRNSLLAILLGSIATLIGIDYFDVTLRRDGSVSASGGGGGGGGARPVVGLGNKCMDVRGGSALDGIAVQINDCNGTDGQLWTRVGNTFRNDGKCLDVYDNGTVNGAVVVLWPCNGGGNQVWVLRSNQSLYNPRSNRCLDVPRADATNGNQLWIWDCHGAPGQRWRVG
jgi:predicted Ser/Thr protein kinase